MQQFILPALSGSPTAAAAGNPTATMAAAARHARIAIIALFALSATAGAQSNADDDDDDERVTILITASRLAETVDETLAPVTVLTREDIEEKQATSVPEVLRAVPGLVFANSGGAGKQTDVFLRGTVGKHLLVLVDGVKVGSATGGAAALQHLPLEQVEKIEVVRGPRSSLYGSEAVGGVIQIFTRRGDAGAQKTAPRFSVSAGSHGTGKAEAGVRGGGAAGWYNLGVSGFTTDGFNACRGRAAQGDFGAPDYVPGAGCFADEPDDDAYRNHSVSLRGGATVNPRLQVEGNFLSANGDTDFDGGFVNQAESQNQVASAKATARVNDNWESQLLVGQSRDETDNFKDGAKRSFFNTRRRQISWQNHVRVDAAMQLLAGVDEVRDEVDSSTDYDENSRDNTGVFALVRGESGGNDWEASARHDDNQQFGGHTTGGVAWGRDVAGKSGDMRFTASLGNAFNAPTFNELYWPCAPGQSEPCGGNPELQPEESTGINLGFTRDLLLQGGRGDFSLNLFRTEIDELIANFPPVNIAEAEIVGAEFVGHWRWDDWQLQVSATMQNPRDAGGGANDGKQLIRRPKRFGNAELARRFGAGAVRLAAEIFAQSAAFADPANTRKTAGFGIVNLRGAARLHKHWRMQLALNNVFDREYETAEFYPQNGANALLTLRYLP